MKILPLLFLLGIVVIAISWFSLSSMGKKTKNLHFPKKETPYTLQNTAEKKLEQKVIAAKQFVQHKNYNTTTCFLIDMSLPSGQNRFVIYDLKKDSVQTKGLVAHGNCFQNWLEGRKYSNVVGCGCTSLGKYKIGIPYTGKFGYSYKLHGLDTSNNNAFERTVVLHSHSCVPLAEVSEDICQSNGCPTVSPDFLKQLKTIINESKKPVLLWLYE